MAGRLRQAEYIPFAFQHLTCSTCMGYGLNSTMQQCSALHITVETNNIRFGFNSTAPTDTTGLIIYKSQQPFFLDAVDCTKIKFRSATALADVSVVGYKRPGDQ